MWLVCASLLWTQMAAAVFFHEKSSIVLAPAGEKNNISFGYSLGYQRGENASLVIGAPLYDLTGRVYLHSIQELLNGTTACEPLDIDITSLNITSDRSLSPNQHFYLGASIAATEKFFVTTAPLRTGFGYNSRYPNGTYHQKFGAFGACVVYDHTMVARACQNYGLDYLLNNRKLMTNTMYGGSGWSSMVTENNIFISKSFNKHDVSYSNLSPRQTYRSLKDISNNYLSVTKDVINYGKSITFGNYFNDNINKTYYAFTFRDMFGKGAIDFYFRNNKWNTPAYRYEDASVGSMFGASIWSADVTGPDGARDGCADLLVGAPAQVADALGFDRGAVHILSKFKSDGSKNMVSKLTIWGSNDGGRFGTTLATSDIDGDSYAEIIISAPFENLGVGALYILGGYEIHTILKKDIKTVHVSELEGTQRIDMSQKSFGFSLQPISDFNENGSDELAVGAPDSSRVTVLLGVRAVTVKVTSRFPNKGLDTDRGSSYIDFSSCLTVDLPPKPHTITMKLLVKNVLIGKGAFYNTKDASYEVDLASEKGTEVVGNLTEYCRPIRIVHASSYKINTTVTAVRNIVEDKEFKNSWVTFSAQSNLTKETPFECECRDGCAPELSTELQWSGGQITDGLVTYMAGSSQSESVYVIVRNTGTRGCGNCAVVTVSGQLYHLQCEAAGVARQFMCALPSPFKGNSSEIFEIQLSMGTLSNQDNNLTVDVELRNHCDEREPKAWTSLTVIYNFTGVLDNLVINGTSMDGEITETDMQDRTEEMLFHEQTYTIINNQSFTWKNIRVNISKDRYKPYIWKRWVTIKHTESYNEFDDFHWRGAITVAPYSAIKVTVSTKISKERLAPYLQNGENITLQSELSLDLLPHKSKTKTLTTVLTFRKEMTIWNNKMLITILALLMAALILIIITIILYKKKFFVRKNKEKLKHEIRRRSIRRESSRRRPPSTHGASEAETMIGAPDCDIPAQIEVTTHTMK